MSNHQQGSILLQAIAITALIAGVAVYSMKNSSTQQKLQKFESNRRITAAQVREIGESLTDWQTCRATLAQGGDVSATVPNVLTRDGAVAYGPGTMLRGAKILDLTLAGYTPAAGVRMSRVTMRVRMEFSETRTNDQGSFGSKTKVYDVPIFLITRDNVVQLCMSDEGNVLESAFRFACGEFGGTFNATSGACDNLHGPDGVVFRYPERYLCSEAGSGCPHPNAGRSCTGTDVRGVSHGNWVVSNFDASGGMMCTCMPRTCENPALFCVGTDMGTDWCTLNCPPATYDPVDFAPDPSTVCAGTTFTQTNSCGRTQSAIGTGGCP